MNSTVELSSEQIFSYIVVIVAFFTTLITVFAKRYRLGSVRRLPPGPPGWPVIGNLAGMIKNRPVHKWMHRVMDEMKTDIACFRFGNVHVVTVTSKEIAREALVDKDEVLADRPEMYSSGQMSGGFKTPVCSRYGQQWKKMRKLMTSELMSPGRLKWLLDARTAEADNILAYAHSLYKQSSKAVNVRDITMTYAHAVVMRMMFGRRHFKEEAMDGEMSPMERDHLEATFKGLGCLFSFSVSDYVPFLRGRVLDEREKMAREASHLMDKYNELIIDERIKLWRERDGKKEIGDWLDIFVSLNDDEGEPLLTPEEIKAECKDIFLATIDNPTNNVEWTLAEMLNRPETLERATEELDEIVGKDRLAQESDIPKLNYIKACSRESFRLHPVSPFVPPHVAMEDTTLAGYFVPKGSHVLVSRVGLGRNPKIWDEPDVFRPERHLGSTEVNLLEPEMRFVSFSTGRRGCIGGKLGTYMTVMLLARLLQGFTWSLPPGSERVELMESDTKLLMAKPLSASVGPRLAPHMYPKFQR
ncbi:PREDICTED: dihomomethionine N-hydroxylase-like [Tarenaya hassleriana]|uniref:dihomomethionine N-hydroxylase-like n=1 Tax=Tarenaya hassleriana TaxID=28532 RepID=UPI00053C3C6F|nr:PREDICTED: dihomomethionine N-hydroxylase-like [Tarenaya hassleriana]